MDPRDDEQTELLRLIWTEMKSLGKNLGGRIDQTNERLDQTNERLHQTNERLHQTNERLDTLRADATRGFEELRGEMGEIRGRVDQLAENDVRLATVVTALAGDVRTLVESVASRRADDRRLRRCEGHIATLQQRVRTLESR